ncbi:hypothetical protein C8P67_105211 [Flavobacterium aquicola]|uniref:Uncharacterized protein n=1 Tax=Flavobacterium aquicola TaxID=1682742 RepID=A0A3E0ELP0_9FLAO|nr:hypothetical protein C8P67_105211 [Flavobacterium aquicola]
MVFSIYKNTVSAKVKVYALQVGKFRFLKKVDCFFKITK